MSLLGPVCFDIFHFVSGMVTSNFEAWFLNDNNTQCACKPRKGTECKEMKLYHFKLLMFVGCL